MGNKPPGSSRIGGKPTSSPGFPPPPPPPPPDNAEPAKCTNCKKPKKEDEEPDHGIFWQKLIDIASTHVPSTSETKGEITMTDIHEELGGKSLMDNLQRQNKKELKWSPTCERSEALVHAIAYFKKSEKANTSPQFFDSEKFKQLITNIEVFENLLQSEHFADPMNILILIRTMLIQYLHDIQSKDAKQNAWSTYMCTNIRDYIHKAASNVLERDPYYKGRHVYFGAKYSLAKSPLDGSLDDKWWYGQDLPADKVDGERFLSSAITIGFIEFMLTKPASTAAGTVDF